MKYLVCAKTGSGHTISYPVGEALARLLAAPAGSAARRRIRAEEEAAGRIRHARAGEIIEDLPPNCAAALVAGGDLVPVVQTSALEGEVLPALEEGSEG